MALSISGMSTQLALTLLDATETQEKAAIENSGAKDFVNNYNVYSFVMQAYDLSDQMFGKAMVQQILESDQSQSGSLINEMTDARFTDLYDGMGFTDNGTQNANTSNTDWQDATVQRYIDQSYINDEADQNSAVGTALEFRQKASSVSSWYDILKDANMGQFMRTVLNLPDSVASLDLDKQVQLMSNKFDITTLQDPDVVSNLVQKYAILTDAQNAAANAQNNSAVKLMGSVVSTWGSSGQFVPATLDITSIDLSSFSASKSYG
ncbi:DUF1217 domain-containing protein [Thioclava sp. BHET1]|nr:DUF1217 domain-containing protein [Thioclava sp. BHET1]